MTRSKAIASSRPRRPIDPITKTPETDRHLIRLICATLVLMALLPYVRTPTYGFIRFDDGLYVADNALVQQGLTWSNLQWALTTMSTTGNWHPLTWLSHMFDCQIFGLRPGWHHLVNILLHAANTLVLFAGLQTLTGLAWRSALVAALFAVHPLHVESVVWIAERKDVLSTFFGLLSMWTYAKYVRAPSLGRYAWVAGFLVLSLLSKPMLVTLPFVFLLLDVWPLKRFCFESGPNRAHRSARSTQKPKILWLVLEKLPLLTLSAVASVVACQAQIVAGAIAPINTWPLSQRLANALIAYVNYLGKTFWPFNLSVIYPFPDHISVPKTLLAFAILVGITIAAGVLIRKRPWLAIGWLWFLGTLVPVIGLVQVGAQSMADRYSYVPLIGVFIMIAWSLPDTLFVPALRSRTAATIVVALVLIALTIVAFWQVQFWRNTTTLFDHALQVTERNYVAHHLLGGALRQQGNFTEARNQFEKSLQLRPDYATARYDLGAMMVQQRDFANALEQFKVALKTQPQDSMIWNGLGMAKAHLGHMEEAISDYRHALELNPNNAYAYANLGAVLLLQGKFDEAIEVCEKALRLRQDQAETHAALAAAYWSRDRAEESFLHNRKALELDPNLFDARFNLGWTLYKTGHNDEAIVHLERALQLKPDHAEAKKALSAAKQARDNAASRP